MKVRAASLAVVVSTGLVLSACGQAQAPTRESPAATTGTGPRQSVGAGEGAVSIVAWAGYVERGETDKAAIAKAFALKGEERRALRQLLQTLEEKQKIVELLGAYLDAKQEAVRVVIGLDEALPSMRNFVLIGAPARVGDDVMGSLAVIGPTRIDYQHTMTAVSYIARLFDKILNETE
jgi:hypothetical protein